MSKYLLVHSGNKNYDQFSNTFLEAILNRPDIKKLSCD